MRLQSNVARSLAFFSVITVTSIAMTVIFAVVICTLGTPRSANEFLVTTILISTFVTVPIAALVAQNDFRMRRRNDELEALCPIDRLTGVFNQKHFVMAAQEELARMQRTRKDAAIIICSVDKFDKLIDAYGASFGDEVLRSIALTAYGQLRGPFDRLGRACVTRSVRAASTGTATPLTLQRVSVWLSFLHPQTCVA